LLFEKDVLLHLNLLKKFFKKPLGCVIGDAIKSETRAAPDSQPFKKLINYLNLDYTLRVREEGKKVFNGIFFIFFCGRKTVTVKIFLPKFPTH